MTGFDPFKFFLKRTGNGLFLVLFFTVLVGLFDGLGIAMFIPLLESATGQSLPYFNLEISFVDAILLIFLFFLLKAVAKYLQNWLKKYNSLRVMKSVKMELLTAMESGSYSFFLQKDIGVIQNALTKEIDKISSAFENYVLTLNGLVLIGVYSAMAIYANPSFALKLLAAMVISHFVLTGFFSLAKRISQRLVLDNDRLQGLLVQFSLNFKYLKATDFSKKFLSIIENKIDQLIKKELKLSKIHSFTFVVREPLVIAIALVLIYWQVGLQKEPVGSILLSILLFYRALTGLNFAQEHYNHFLAVSGSLANIQSQMESFVASNENVMVDNTSSVNPGAPFLIAEGLSFEFEGSTLLLDKVNFVIPRNATIAFKGETGSGKSTLVNLFCGLLTPTQGRLLIHGVPIQQLPLSRWRKKIAYVTQEPIVFNDTLFNNITLWAVESQENVVKFWEVLKKAQLYDWAEKTGKDALLGALGTNISGGQRQRLSIARELYKDFDLLLLDEATSALDEDTENAIYHSLLDLKGKHTIIIISHRPKMLELADRVYTLENGQLI